MKARERVRIAMRGGIPDRVPVFPVITDMHTSKMFNIPLWQARFFDRLWFDLLEKAVVYYGLDGVEVPMNSPIDEIHRYEIKEEGNKKVLYEDGIPKSYLLDDNYPTPYTKVQQPIIKSIDDIKNMTYLTKDEILKKGMCNEIMRFREKFKDDLYMSSYACAFTMNGLVEFRGSENAFTDLYENPELVHALFEFLTNKNIEIAKALIEAGIDAIYTGDAFASCSLISPDDFREFCLPYYKKFVNALKDYDVDIYMHICGNAVPLFEMIAESGVNGVEPLDPMGGVSVADVKKRVGDKLCLKGGVSTLILLFGTVEDVEKETKRVLEEGMKNGGFMVGSGDDIPRNASMENVKAMVDAVHKYGVYKK